MEVASPSQSDASPTSTATAADATGCAHSWCAQVPLVNQFYRFPAVFIFSIFVLAIALNITTERMPSPTVDRPLPDMLQQVLPKVASLEALTDALLSVMNISVGWLFWKLYLLHRKAEGRQDITLPFRVPILSSLLVDVWASEELEAQDRQRKRKATSGGSTTASPVPASQVRSDGTSAAVVVVAVEPSFDGDDQDAPCKPTVLPKVENCYRIAWVRFFSVYALVLFFRAPVIMLTSMPATDNHCQSKPAIDDPVQNILMTMVTLGSKSIHCGDLMFSGHAVNGAIGCLTLWTYGPMLWRFVKPFGCAVMVGTWVSILMARSHYTTDIVMALYVTVTMYWLVPHDERGAPIRVQWLVRFWPLPQQQSSSPQEGNPESEGELQPPNRGEGRHTAPEQGGSIEEVKAPVARAPPKESPRDIEASGGGLDLSQAYIDARKD